MSTVWDIYIASKGRPDSKLIAELGANATVVVEPHEVELYAAAPRKLVLPASHGGIAVVRNFILDYARRRHLWFWMLDDDITAWHLNYPRKKAERVSALDALYAAQLLIENEPNVGQAAIEYQQFAWAATKRFVKNGYCDVAVAINTQRTRGLSYRGEANLKEDRDFTLQVLTSGRQTMRIQSVGFTAPKNGSNKGGLADVYAEKGREEVAVDAMVRLWPGVVTKQVKGDGRIDCKINWRVFK